MKTQQNITPAAPVQDPTPHLTIISHSDNEHPEADDVINEILRIMQSIEVLTPFVFNIISATQSKSFTIPPTK